MSSGCFVIRPWTALEARLHTIHFIALYGSIWSPRSCNKLFQLPYSIKIELVRTDVFKSGTKGTFKGSAKHVAGYIFNSIYI